MLGSPELEFQVAVAVMWVLWKSSCISLHPLFCELPNDYPPVGELLLLLKATNEGHRCIGVNKCLNNS